MSKEKTDLLQGTLDMLILKALQLGPMHGFGIFVLIHQHNATCVCIKGSAVSIGGTKLAHLQAAELRGVVRAAAAASGAEVRTMNKAAARLSNGGTIEKGQQIAAHESPRTTKLYDRTNDEISLDEVERILI